MRSRWIGYLLALGAAFGVAHRLIVVMGRRWGTEPHERTESLPGDELVPYTSCRNWWEGLSDADLNVVVVLSERTLATTELGDQIIDAPMRWLRAAGAPVVLAGRDAVVFDVQSASPACDD